MNTVVVLFCVFSTISSRGLHEEFSWTRINYQWPEGQARSAIEKSEMIAFPGTTNMNERTTRRPNVPPRPGSTSTPGTNNVPYIYENNIPMGANVWRNKLFITVPRRRVGVPSTLNFVWLNNTDRKDVPLIPYPDWETNTLPESGNDATRFVSVYRVAVDSCDRLWFVDTGRMEIPGDPQQIQDTALVIMDLNTNQILQRYVFNSSLLRPTTTLASVTVDITDDNCGDAYAYFPDLGGFGLIVYSLRENRAWRVTHDYFYLEPLAGNFKIGGHRFQWNDGIFSIAISDVKSDGYRDAYFHSMAGFNLYRVSTKILKNEMMATRSYHGDDFEFLGQRGELSQASSSDLHKSKGILFFGYVNQNAVACWNIQTPLTDVSIVQKNDEKMIYPCDLKISDDKVVILTNTMPVFLYGTLDYNTTNFRIWVETVDTAIRGTKCDPRRATKY